jgi:two-component system cell cycle response regulator
MELEAQSEVQYAMLVVDDDRDVRELIQEVVSRMGYTSAAVVDGLEALDYLADHHVDIVITDINMPRLDGMALIRRIRADFGEVDVVAVTGYSDRYKYTDVVEAGASDFICKPFDVNELEAKVIRIIRERSLREQLRRLSVRDGLTGLYNRRFFDDNLRREASRAFRQNYGLYLLIIDIDNFKEYNDRYGHQQGDEVLKRVADLMLLSIRNNVDSAYRYGGDEFATIIPHANFQQAFMVAERLRGKYGKDNMPPTSLSIGMAKLAGGIDTLSEDVDKLIRDADRCLYLAKRNGGDQVRADHCEATDAMST